MNEQQRQAILALITRRLAADPTFILPQLTPYLRDNGFPPEIRQGVNAKPWLLANFPELGVRNENGTDYIFLQDSDHTSIPPRVRQAFYQRLREHLDANSYAKHSLIPSLIPEWQSYKLSSDERLGAWLSRNFSDREFATRMINNAAALFLPETASAIDRIIQMTRSMISETGNVTVSALVSALQSENLKWDKLPPSTAQSVGEWLANYCPDITYSDQSQTVLCLRDAAVVPPQPPVQPLLDATKQALVYGYAFLPFAGAPLTSLREVLGDPSYNTNMWKKQSIDVFFDILMGIGDGLLDDSMGNPPRMAFNTGLVSQDQKHIYCILRPNTSASATQRWKGDRFCYPGQDDPDGHGKWLCKRFGLVSENADTVTDAYSQVENAIEELKGLQHDLLSGLDTMRTAVRDCNPVSKDFCDRLMAYTQHWDQIFASVQALGREIPQDEPPMKYVDSLLAERNSITVVLDRLKDDYRALSEGCWEYLSDKGLLFDENPDIGTDAAILEERMGDGHLSSDQIKAIFQELLEPCYAFQTLAFSQTANTDEARKARETLEIHFNADITPRYATRYFANADKEQFAFLSRLDDIRTKLEQLEMNTPVAAPDQKIRLDPLELVRQLLDTENIQLIYRQYPRPNPFETMILREEYENALNFSKDETQMADLGYTEDQRTAIILKLSESSGNTGARIYTAATNLFEIQGNLNRQAEKYMLLSLILEGSNISEHLMNLYAEEGQLDVLEHLYQIYGRKLSADVRARYLCPLIEEGYISVADTVREDVLGFLAIKDAVLLDKFCLDGQLTDEQYQHIHKIRDCMQNPFIRQIVFLDSALFRFIQQPENMEAIQNSGIRHTAESLGNLLRMGNYPRGQDPISTAQRLWQFVEDWKGVAESFAVLSEDSVNKSILLWNISQKQQDTDKMLQLLRRNGHLQKQYFTDYCDLLFSVGAHQEYFDVASGAEALTARMQLQFTISAILTEQWDGTVPMDLSDQDLVDSAELIVLLAQTLIRSGQLEALGQFLRQYFEQMVLHCSTESIRRIITAGGDADESVLMALQAQAIAQEEKALGVYIGTFLGGEQSAFAGEEYYRDLMTHLPEESPLQQMQNIRKLQLLFPAQYTNHYPDLFPHLLRFELSRIQGVDDQSAASLEEMITPQSLSAAAMPTVLELLLESGCLSHPVILESLERNCSTAELKMICMDYLHNHRNTLDNGARRLLCRLYRNALETGVLAGDLLEEARDVSLQLVKANQDITAVWCVSVLEERLGRIPYGKFAQLYLHSNNDRSASEADQEAEDISTELSLFRSVLEDPDSDVGNYLNFCACFRLFSVQDQAVTERLMQPGQEGVLTEAEHIIPVLHGLYENNRDPQYLAASSRLPLRDDPTVYGRLLYHGAFASSSPAAWKTCTEYCEKFRLDDLLAQSLLKWILLCANPANKNLQWYELKAFFNAIRMLCNRSDGAPSFSNQAVVQDLLKQMCGFFIRIDSNGADFNHISLRTIVEFAVLTGNEDILLSQNEIMEKFLGPRKQLCLVFACRLLQRQCFEKARSLLISLSNTYGQMTYKDLVIQLSQMDGDALAEWTRMESSQMLLKYFLLPDGNVPSVQNMRIFLMDCLVNGTQHSGIQVAEQLIHYFETEYMCYELLFILCKENFMGYLPQIQRALAGMYAYSPKDRKSTRTVDEVLKLLSVTCAVMDQLGVPQSIDDLNGFIRKHNILADSAMLSDKVDYHTRLRENVQAEFIGLSEEERRLLVEGLLGSVSGNWVPFLTGAYRHVASEADSAVRTQIIVTYVNRCCCSSWGLMRSVLLGAQEFPEEEMQDYLNTINNVMLYYEQHKEEKPRSLKGSLALSKFINGKMYGDTYRNFLKLPWEEHFICLGDVRIETGNVIDSCYAWMWQQLRNAPQGFPVGNMLYMHFRLAQDPLCPSKLKTDVDRVFQAGEFSFAGPAYDALYAQAMAVTRISNMPENRRQQAYQDGELFQCRSRLSKFFMGDPAVVKKFSGSLSIHSAANIIVALLQSKHALELNRLAHCFRQNTNAFNRSIAYELCADILKLVNPDVSDEVKESIFNSYRTDFPAKISIAKILSTRNADFTAYLFTKTPALGDKMKAVLPALMGEGKKQIYLTFSGPVPSYIYSQVIDGDDPDEYSVAEDLFENKQDFLPGFAVEAHTALQGQTISVTLDELYQQEQQCLYDDYEGRMACTRMIYYLVSRDQAPASFEVITALLNYGLAYRNYYLSTLSDRTGLTEEEKQKNRTLARKVILDMATYCTADHMCNMENLPGIPFVESLQQIFCADFASIDDLLEDYRTNRSGYHALLQLISDKSVRDVAGYIFRTIQDLVECYRTAGPKDQNSRAYRTAYQKAYETLEQIPYNRTWNDSKNVLLKHLMHAINNLEMRPDLNIRILNPEEGYRWGSLTGIMMNTGRFPAENITLQAIFGGGVLSNTYSCEELLPNEQICFDVGYSAPEDAATLSYTLNVSYSFRGKTSTATPRTGELKLQDNVSLLPVSDPYGAHKAIVFSTDAQGTVVGDGFFGRNTEKHLLHSLANPDYEFYRYHNAVIQGFRRTGKTSLLNYFKEYVRRKCGDKAIPVYVDGLNCSVQPIHGAFVKHVMSQVEIAMPELMEDDRWARFKQTWSLSEDDPDRNPDTLEGFYLGLGRMLNGKGVILLLDEVDRLFERIDETHGAISTLFPALRAIQNNTDCQKVIHMVFCGSNNLLIYNQIGGKLHQLFETFSPITVGQLKKEDVKALLQSPFEKLDPITFHPEAIEWAWRCTGGLVYYTKLLGNYAVDRVIRERRSIIYPIDISHAFDSTATEQNCKQYIEEGCTKDEKLVLDAMATLSPRYGTDVTVGQLAGLIGSGLTEVQLDRSLKVLTDTLGLLERSGSNRNAYHFSIELYRRFYRSQPSVFERKDAPADRMTLRSVPVSVTDDDDDGMVY